MGITGGTGALLGKNMTYFTFCPKRAPVPPKRAPVRALLGGTSALLGKNMTYFTFSPHEGGSLGRLGALAPSWGKK